MTDPLKEQSYRFHIEGGAGYSVDTPVTDEGGGWQPGVGADTCPNTRDCYGLSLELQFNKMDGGDLYNDYEHDRYLLGFNRFTLDSPNTALSIDKGSHLRVGLGDNNGVGTFEMGKGASGIFNIRPSDSFPVFRLATYYGLFTSIPTDETGEESITQTALRVGINVQIGSDAQVTTAPTDELTAYDPWHFALSQLFGVTLNTRAAKTAGYSVEANAYMKELLGSEGGSPSGRLEGLSSLQSIGAYAAAASDDELPLMLRAKEGQSTAMTAAKIGSAASHLLFSADDESSTLLANGIADGLKLAHYAILSDDKNAFLSRELLNGAVFMIGFAAGGSRVGNAFAQGAQSAMLFTALNPDPAQTGLDGGNKSWQGLYRVADSGEKHVGFQSVHHLANGYYTAGRLYFQSSPASQAGQGAADFATGRDPATEAANAETVAALGKEARTGGVTWGAGLRTLLKVGESTQAGIGMEASVHLLLGGERKVPDIAIIVAADRIGGSNRLSISPGVGLRF